VSVGIFKVWKPSQRNDLAGREGGGAEQEEEKLVSTTWRMILDYNHNAAYCSMLRRLLLGSQDVSQAAVITETVVHGFFRLNLRQCYGRRHSNYEQWLSGLFQWVRVSVISKGERRKSCISINLKLSSYYKIFRNNSRGSRKGSLKAFRTFGSVQRMLLSLTRYQSIHKIVDNMQMIHAPVTNLQAINFQSNCAQIKDIVKKKSKT
jgi:hypothetical protein